VSNKPKYYDSMRLEHLSGQFFHTIMKPLKKTLHMKLAKIQI
jgi:hypothetical protein